MAQIVEIKRDFYIVSLSAAILISLLSVFTAGVVVNTQQLYVMNTYSGGFPFTWFEFYYPLDYELTIAHVLNNFNLNNMKIDLLVFVFNVLLLNMAINALICFESRVCYCFFVLAGKLKKRDAHK